MKEDVKECQNEDMKEKMRRTRRGIKKEELE